MFDSDIQRLDRQAQSRVLAGLENGVWAELDQQARQSRAARTVAAWQAAVLALALVSSLGAGAMAATRLPASGLDVFSPHRALAPSTLLAGD